MTYSLHVAGKVKVIEARTAQSAARQAHEWAHELGVPQAQVLVYPDTRIDDER